MSNVSTEEIRSKFISYFSSHNHSHVATSSLIPHNDPTLMFVNSGMVQFKNVFTGQEKRSYDKAVTSQKALRAGGKHNDLENVGYTARHHTFFEMLGNFSFGDYFKEQAVYYAWNLLTKEFLLSKEKLYITVYHTDEETITYWKKIANFSDDRIIKIKTNDNFWSMGDTGPCGPCSEIFYDHGEAIKGGLPGTKDEDGDRYVEIWNMVFMQYEQINNTTKIELPHKSIDTGMGLERIAAVLQGVHSNYEIDLFQEIINFAENILQVKVEGEAKFSYQVIADHIRALAFLIADGIVPSNEGRGYVLRRIMRRSMRHAHLLGAKEPVMYKIVNKLVDLMGHAYPELQRTKSLASSILEQEEVRFKITLDKGLKLLDEETKLFTVGSELNGDTAFKLYDTYGFPIDLTEDILRNRQITVDHKGFEDNMRQQKERAKKSWAGSGESQTNQLWFDIKEKFGSTEFLGYAFNEATGRVLALIKDAQLINTIAEPNSKFCLISNQTPFYGESGGQMGDIGHIFAKDTKLKVVNSLKYLGSIIVHECILEKGSVSVSDHMNFVINTKYRQNLRVNHSATHLLHSVLREILGPHVTQKGSLVSHDYLRFDINHTQAITTHEIKLIENRVNQLIRDNYEVNTSLMSIDDAMKLEVTALFGEKYDQEVRVVSMGDGDKSYSLELCGGTHVGRTGDIGCFKITNESAIAAGIRRIEAVCGEFVIDLMQQQEILLKSIENVLRTNKRELVLKVSGLLDRNKELEKNLIKTQLSSLDLSIEQINDLATKIKDIKLIYKLVENIDSKILQQAAEELSKKAENLVVLYTTKAHDKIMIIIAVSKNIADKFSANNLAKELSLFLGGSGGGRTTIAQASGKDLSKLSFIERQVSDLLEKIHAQ